MATVLYDKTESRDLEAVGSKLIDASFHERKPAWVGGQISTKDSDFLSGLVQWDRPQNCVEIGVASGWSSAVLLTTLEKVHGDKFTMSGIDLFEEYYLDKSIPTGNAVREVTPQLANRYRLLTGRYAFEEMSTIGAIDFAFIDAQHMHPWATLDMIAVLPYLQADRWIALHDLNLCRFERHKHMNRGPFYLFNFWPDQKINSTQEPSMIGAVRLQRKAADYLPVLLETLWTPWEIPVDATVRAGLRQFISTHFGQMWADKFHEVFEAESARLARNKTVS